MTAPMSKRQAQSNAEMKPRIPPHHTEAEQSILGALLLRPDLFHLLTVQPSDFYSERHQLIFQAILELERDGVAIDVISVSQKLGPERLERLGSISYLTELSDVLPSTANIEYYDHIVVQKSSLRALIRACSENLEEAFSEDLDAEVIDEFLDKAEARVHAVKTKRNPGELKQAGAFTRPVFARLEALYNGELSLTGLPTGLSQIDEMTGGLQPAQFIILAARPSMGKTSCALGMAHAMARVGRPVAFFSLEMSAEQIYERLVCQICKVSSAGFQNPKKYLRDVDIERLFGAAQEVQKLPLFIDDSAHLSPMSLRSHCRRLKSQQGDLGAVVVDYLQLMDVDQRGRNDTRAQDVSAISRSMKLLAKELNCPVVALSQLNRTLERRPDKRPIMSDLRESGSLEQDTDVIMFIYRDEIYHPDTDEQGIAEIIIGKQRNGPIGTVRTRFHAESTQFSDLYPGTQWKQ